MTIYELQRLRTKVLTRTASIDEVMDALAALESALLKMEPIG